MNRQIISRILLAAFALSVWLSQPVLVLAQTPARDKPPVAPGTPITTAPIPPSQTVVTEHSATAPAESQVIYGLQGVLVETLDGKTVAEQAADENFNPASAIKLATALVALKTFGPQHRFTIGIWTSGTFDKATGTLNGKSLRLRS